MQRWSWACIAAVGTAVGLVGCGDGGAFKPADQLPQTAHDDHGHDHDHGHGAEGPHHGALIEFGEEEYHGEIVVDHAGHALKLYLLGPDAKSDATTAATEATLAIAGGAKLTLKPAADQPEGQASLFELIDESAIAEIEKMGFIHGDLTIKIGDKEFMAGVDAHFHEDHDHAEMPKSEETAPAAEGAASADPTTPAEAPKAE
ncbi:MAG: hypothetical protein B7Z55_12725 [Planctomycetales bacterium 12-60-4]|nr:MAG: hypothetical protein B7Z55_12725 [Planctomycetales bacterium 12-60-4]